jgi:hypothetical protein
MKYHCRNKDNKVLSIHRSIEEALRARDVWNHTIELIGISDESGRLLEAQEIIQHKAATWMKGLR